MVLPFLFVLFTVSYSSFSQNKTNKTAAIKSLISKKRSFNNTYGFGYRIQIFYGEENSARNSQNRFSSTFPDVYTKLSYDQPYWKVQVGNYKTKLEADKALMNFSNQFSGLIVVSVGK